MVRMAGAPSDKMIDGGNAVFFQTVNNVIDNARAWRRWFEGVGQPLRGQGHSHGPHQACPMPYLYKSIMNDLEDYRLYVAGIGGRKNCRMRTPSRPRTRSAGARPAGADFVEASQMLFPPS